MSKRSKSKTHTTTHTTTHSSATDVVELDALVRYRDAFNENKTNHIIQNALCNGDLDDVAEVRTYMQSLDFTFSHVIEPELHVTNQGLSGRCWLFAVLNVIRHEMVRKFHLPHDFELSEAYVAFWDKLERCNYVLSYFAQKRKIDYDSRQDMELLMGGCTDGGLRVTCVNLIKKYGIVPKCTYRESSNSSDTSDLVTFLNTKIREFVMELMKIDSETERAAAKARMLEQLYGFLCKMLGTPPHPDEKINWCYELYVDLDERLERVKRRRENDEKYENVQIKRHTSFTPRQFYQTFVVHPLDDYVNLGNDPRNVYHRYYLSKKNNVVLGGEKHGYYNVPMSEITKYCIASILDNTPVEFDCDVIQYNKPSDELLDTKCFNYDMLFNTTLQKLDKADRIRCMESYPTHAMVLVGVDLNERGEPMKWKVENSWSIINPFKDGGSLGYWTMSNEWFLEYGFNAFVHRKYFDSKYLQTYDHAMKHPVLLPENDPFAE